MPQRGFHPRLCLGWLDELVAHHANSRQPLLSTACDTARWNKPVIQGRENSRPFYFISIIHMTSFNYISCKQARGNQQYKQFFQINKDTYISKTTYSRKFIRSIARRFAKRTIVALQQYKNMATNPLDSCRKRLHASDSFTTALSTITHRQNTGLFSQQHSQCIFYIYRKLNITVKGFHS